MLDFIGIGVSRSGTTWTWNQLKSHPDICPTVKEANTFVDDKDTEVELKKYKKCDSQYFVGEYTPCYFNKHEVADKIKSYCPKAKLLLILRNPLDRIFTQYKASQWKEHKKVGENFISWFKNNDRKIARNSGNYMHHLPFWSKHFKGKLKVDLYDDLVADPLSYIQDVFQHIGIKKNFVPPHWRKRERKPYNVYFNKHPLKVSRKEKQFVKRHYKQSILDLQDYLGRDLSHWLEI